MAENGRAVELLAERTVQGRTMLARDAKDQFRTPFKTLKAALVNSFLGFAGKAAADKAALERKEKDLLWRLRERKKPFRGLRSSGGGQLAIESLREIRKLRRLSLRESEQLFLLSRNKPCGELQLYFASGSSEISPAEPALKRLGEALAHADLRGKLFLIAGHTCRQGGVERSEELSIARAEAVRLHLVEKFGAEPDALLPHGFGFRYLKNPQNPFAQENHRFEIVNLSE
jgi:outer membrane protein OmpA-like peptidoglycan-associated protein